MTQEGEWEQPDLYYQPRKDLDDVLGNWDDQIKSVQCFWIRWNARSTEETGSILDSTNAHKDVLDTSNEPALVDETPVAKDLELRDTLEDDHVLTRLYDADNFVGDIIAHATQKDAHQERCIKTFLKKGVFIRSIGQTEDTEGAYFVCSYYDDDHCNSTWNNHGIFPTFYLEPNGFIQFNFAYKIMSFRCRYPHPDKRT